MNKKCIDLYGLLDSTLQWGVIEKGVIYSVKITDRMQGVPFSVYERRISREQLEDARDQLIEILEKYKQ